MVTYKIALIDGDNIGPELMKQVEKILIKIMQLSNIKLDILRPIAFGKSIDLYKNPFTENELIKTIECDAVIIGNIGEKKYMHLNKSDRPEGGFIKLRNNIGVCSSIRRAVVRENLESLSSLKPQLINGLDITVIRDIQGGMYSGIKSYTTSENEAADVEFYNSDIIKNSATHAFELASLNNLKITSIDKSNVLNTGYLWRNIIQKLSKSYPNVQINYDYADNVAMKVIQNPKDFEIILANNVFGDVISDEVAAITGTPNLFGNSELSPSGKGIYTPNQLHYPNEEHINKNIVSPIGIISSLVDLFTFSIKKPAIAKSIEKSIEKIFIDKLTTADLPVKGFKILTTDEMGDALAENIKL